MNVLLIQPPLLLYTKLIKLPNIGLASIAAVLEEAGITVKVVDANAEGISLDQIIERIKDIKPDIVGSGGQTPISHFSLEIFKRTKLEVNKNIVTLAGGPHFSFTDEESLKKCPELDIVVRGEAEFVLLDLCKHLEQGKDLCDVRGITYRSPEGRIVKNPNQDPIKNLDDLPLPAWHLFPVEKYTNGGHRLLSTTTSRGCAYKCPHCITWKIHKNVRLRSPKSIVEEMIHVKENYGHDIFFFHDDQSFANREQLEGFLKELESRDEKLSWSFESREEVLYAYRDLWERMKANGLFKLYFGIDTPDAEMRKTYNRSKFDKERFEEMLSYLEHTLDIMVYLYFTIGHPSETEESIHKTIQYAKYLYPDLCSFIIINSLKPFPGTEIYSEMKKNDLILTEDWRYYGAETSVIKTIVSPEKLEQLFFSFYKKLYSRPKVAAIQLKALFSRNKFRRSMAKNFFYTAAEILKTRKIANS